MIYHIMQRGARKREIVRDDDDRRCFMRILKKALYTGGGIEHTFCLMTNHYHLILETGEQPPWNIMKPLAQNYAMHFNHKYKQTGHVFSDRYIAVPVKTDAYLLQSSRYIHLNPVKAHMVAAPEDYRWSSYRCYHSGYDDGITYTDTVLGYFEEGASGYCDYVMDMSEEALARDYEVYMDLEEGEEW